MRLILFAFILSLSACAQQAARHSAQDSAYQTALRDAASIEAEEIFPRLVAIVSDNAALEWRNGLLKVVTWTNYPGYDKALGQALPLSREVWVTTSPELQQFCRALPEALKTDPTRLQLRLEQKLGLPPGGNKDRIVALWVHPEDLFRPCPDAEISDSVCGTRFPDASSSGHQAWFGRLSAGSYVIPGGYPWTRLGYTYDWNPDDVEFGLSEFVIRAGSQVIVDSVTPTAAYCR